MIDKVFAYLEDKATARNTKILFGLVILFLLSFQVVAAITGGDTSLTPLDVRIQGYTAENVFAYLDQLGAPGRQREVITHLTIDFVFPPVFGLFFVFWIVYVWRQLGEGQLWRWLLLVPLGAVLADYTENFAIIALARAYPRQLIALAMDLPGFSSLKWGLVFSSILLGLLGSLAFRQRKDA